MNDNLEIMEHQAEQGLGFFELSEATQEFVEAVAVAVEELTGGQVSITNSDGVVFVLIKNKKCWANGLIMVIKKVKGHEVISNAKSERMKKVLERLIANKT